MRALIHLQSTIGWTVSIQVLFWVLFIPYTVAVPFEFSPALTEHGLQANQSRLPLEHLFKRGSGYSSLTFASNCDTDQQNYVKAELDEIQTMLTRAKAGLSTIRSVIMDKEQPEDWGTRYSEYSRLLNTWQNYFGRIQLNKWVKQTPKQGSLTTFTQAASNMQRLISIYDQISKALSGSTLNALLNCNDAFFEWQDPGAGADPNAKRVYVDTREEDASTPITLISTGRLCHESDNAHGWSFRNTVTRRDEICICPGTFKRTNTANKLTQYPNDPEALKGKSLNDLKYNAAAGTLLHELTHCQHILEGARTEDMAYNDGKTTTPAYLIGGVRGLAYYNPGDTMKNADTLAFFGLAMYYSQCDWSFGICGEAKDPYTMKDKTGKVVYMKFEY